LAIGSHRLVGFAFASADLLIEVSPAGTIPFAMGASEALSGSSETELVGRAWRDFVDPADHGMLAMFFEGLEPGARAGPVLVRLAAPEHAATLTAFRLPQNEGAISCALSRARYGAALDAGRLRDRAAFEALACELLESAKQSGRDLELSLVELEGLAAAKGKASKEARQQLEAHIAGVLRAQAYGGQAATELAEGRFALVRAGGEAPEALVQRLVKLIGTATAEVIVPSARAIAMEGVERPQQVLRALRHALDGFAAQGRHWKAPANLADALNAAIQRTLDDAGALGAAIRDKAFRLAYQPVVRLDGLALHHFEVLVRFGDEESPFPQIRMAEEMDLIESLDFAILERSIETLTRSEGLKLAVNVSGRTIASSAYVERAVALIRSKPGIHGRLMFELTESAAIDDLALADRHLQALRGEGCEICLDDFGAGAASLAYLQQLHLDVLKIDGRFIRDLQYGGRGATFVKHLVRMCHELGMKTLAEMVETSAVEAEVRRAGVDFAQGWLYGLATDEPVAPTPNHVWASKGAAA
jgi:EAL domain-containing protein (putative c-di-GMP-specific phosphodiesterase class I)